MTNLLRYYQTLLKSIPATLAAAEEQINKKHIILATTPEATIQTINEQIELAKKIERHLEFFIKWDQQTELGLPKTLKESFRQFLNLSRTIQAKLDIPLLFFTL